MLAHPPYLTIENLGIRTIRPSQMVTGLDPHGAAKIQPFHVHNQNVGILYDYYQTKKAELQGTLGFDTLMMGISPNETATAIQAKKAQAVDAMSHLISALESELLNPLIKNMIRLLLAKGHTFGLDEESYLIFRDLILPSLDVYCVGETKQIQNMYVLQNLMSWYEECLEAAKTDPSALICIKLPQLLKKIGELRGADESLTRSDEEAEELMRRQAAAAEEERRRQQEAEIAQQTVGKMDFGSNDEEELTFDDEY